MIWYFLAGLIAGAVGWHRIITWYANKLKQERDLKKLRGEDDDRN